MKGSTSLFRIGAVSYVAAPDGIVLFSMTPPPHLADFSAIDAWFSQAHSTKFIGTRARSGALPYSSFQSAQRPDWWSLFEFLPVGFSGRNGGPILGAS